MKLDLLDHCGQMSQDLLILGVHAGQCFDELKPGSEAVYVEQCKVHVLIQLSEYVLKTDSVSTAGRVVLPG